MQSYKDNPRNKKGLMWLLVSVVVFALIAIGLVAALVINSQSELHLVSAQEDSEDQNSKANEPLITSPTTQVINLVSLMGMSEDDAIQAIGHGATVQDQETLSSLGFSNEIVVLLADEKGDTYSGTPTVTLGLDAEGNVAAASYEAPCSLLGYGDVAFAPAVTQFHIVEFILEKIGLTNTEIGSIKLPDSSEYSTYESDRKTLLREHYSFSGNTSENEQAYSWEVTLDYDYSEANEQSNLAYTVKRVSVAIMKA